MKRKPSEHYGYKKNLEGKYGKWSVYGEDPNCDLGGIHKEPFLGYFEGKYEEVWQHAIDNIRSFYTWGGGGRITEAKPENSKVIVLSSSRQKKLERITGKSIRVYKLINAYKKLSSAEKEEFKKRFDA